MSLKDKYYQFRSYLNIIQKDRKDRFPLPLPLKMKLWKQGFLAEKHVLYGLDKHDSSLYLTDYQASMARWINAPFNELLTNKYIFEKIVGQHIRVPTNYGIIVNGTYHPQKEYTLNWVLDGPKQFVIKPIDGGGGRGVYIISKEAADTYLLNRTESISKQALELKLGQLNNYLVMEFIQQSNFSQGLYPKSVNSIRALTLIDPQTQEPFLARAVQRIGVAKSAPQDNFTKGGLSANINLETGQLGRATCHPKRSVLDWFDAHPDTGDTFAGQYIPNWATLKSALLKATAALPMLPCVGWDLVITDEGLVAIEGNHHPDPDVLQAHEPLLSDKRINDFYRFHKIIT